jgi:hypothetical protein
VQWAKQAGGIRGDDGYAVAIGPDDEVVLAGAVFTTANFDDASYATSDFSTDGFIARLQPLPAPLSVRLRAIPPGTQLEISGSIGKTVTLQGSTSLRSPVPWQDLTNFVLTTSPVMWTDSLAGGLIQRFYRARIQP